METGEVNDSARLFLVKIGVLARLVEDGRVLLKLTLRVGILNSFFGAVPFPFLLLVVTDVGAFI